MIGVIGFGELNLAENGSSAPPWTPTVHIRIISNLSINRLTILLILLSLYIGALLLRAYLDSELPTNPPPPALAKFVRVSFSCCSRPKVRQNSKTKKAFLRCQTLAHFNEPPHQSHIPSFPPPLPLGGVSRNGTWRLLKQNAFMSLSLCTFGDRNLSRRIKLEAPSGHVLEIKDEPPPKKGAKVCFLFFD